MSQFRIKHPPDFHILKSLGIVERSRLSESGSSCGDGVEIGGGRASSYHRPKPRPPPDSNARLIDVDIETEEDDDMDDVLYDQTKLLRSSSSPMFPYSESKESKRVERCRAALVFIAFVNIGLCLGIVGPTLPDLQVNTSSQSFHSTVSLISANALGAMVALVLGSVIFKYANPLPVMMLALLCLSVLTFIIPWSQRLSGLNFVFLLQGFCMGLVERGGFSLASSYWKRNFRLIHSLFIAVAIGGLLATLFTSPFVANHFITPNSTSHLSANPYPEESTPASEDSNGGVRFLRHKRDTKLHEGELLEKESLLTSSLNQIGKDLTSDLPPTRSLFEIKDESNGTESSAAGKESSQIVPSSINNASSEFENVGDAPVKKPELANAAGFANKDDITWKEVKHGKMKESRITETQLLHTKEKTTISDSSQLEDSANNTDHSGGENNTSSTGINGSSDSTTMEKNSSSLASSVIASTASNSYTATGHPDGAMSTTTPLTGTPVVPTLISQPGSASTRSSISTTPITTTTTTTTTAMPQKIKNPPASPTGPTPGSNLPATPVSLDPSPGATSYAVTGGEPTSTTGSYIRLDPDSPNYYWKMMLQMSRKLNRSQFAYLLTGIVSLVSSLLFMGMCCVRPCQMPLAHPKPPGVSGMSRSGSDAARRSSSGGQLAGSRCAAAPNTGLAVGTINNRVMNRYRSYLMAVLFAFQASLTGVVASIYNLWPVYSIVERQQDQAAGALSLSGFWLAMTVMRGLVTVILFRRLSVHVVMVSSLVFSLVALSLMAVGGSSFSWPAVSTIVILAGIGLASIDPVLYTWVEGQLNFGQWPITAILVGGHAGRLIVPVAVAAAMKSHWPGDLLLSLVVLTVIGGILYGLGHRLARRVGQLSLIHTWANHLSSDLARDDGYSANQENGGGLGRQSPSTGSGGSSHDYELGRMEEDDDGDDNDLFDDTVHFQRTTEFSGRAPNGYLKSEPSHSGSKQSKADSAKGSGWSKTGEDHDGVFGSYFMHK